MTQAEEIAFWEGFGDGRGRDSIGGPRCVFRDPGLANAYGDGFAAGNAELRGKPWVFPLPAGGPPVPWTPSASSSTGVTPD